MKDIYISAAYALLPIILVFPFTTLLSNVITLEEAPILRVLDILAVIATFLLLFVGNMITHQYPLATAIGMSLLTVVAIGIIIFLTLLFMSFIGQVWAFLLAIFKELTYRIQ